MPVLRHSMVITSLTNAHVKYIRSLVANRRERANERCFVVEGILLVNEVLASNHMLRLVLYSPTHLVASEAGQRLLQQLDGKPNCYEASDRVIAAVADTVTPQGVVAVVPWPELSPRYGVWLVLDGIQDPGNVGTLLRSAEAAGVGQVLCSPGTVDIYSSKVVRAAMGAHCYLPLQNHCAWSTLSDMLQNKGPIYATVAGRGKPYYAVDWCQAGAVIIGNEAHGISKEGLSVTTEHIAIPMTGRIASLNAAIAGSIILFEMVRQKAESHML